MATKPERATHCHKCGAEFIGSVYRGKIIEGKTLCEKCRKANRMTLEEYVRDCRTKSKVEEAINHQHPSKIASTEKMLSTRDVAAMLNVDLRTAQRLCASGKFPAINVAVGARKRKWRVAMRDLELFIKTPANTPTPLPVVPMQLPPHIKRRA